MSGLGGEVNPLEHSTHAVLSWHALVVDCWLLQGHGGDGNAGYLHHLMGTHLSGSVSRYDDSRCLTLKTCRIADSALRYDGILEALSQIPLFLLIVLPVPLVIDCSRRQNVGIHLLLHCKQQLGKLRGVNLSWGFSLWPHSAVHPYPVECVPLVFGLYLLLHQGWATLMRLGASKKWWLQFYTFCHRCGEKC